MKCPYCNNEMIIGKIELYSNPPGFITQKFISEEQLNKTLGRKLKETVQEVMTGISMNDSIILNNNEKAYYCDACRIGFVEFKS